MTSSIRIYECRKKSWVVDIDPRWFKDKIFEAGQFVVAEGGGVGLVLGRLYSKESIAVYFPEGTTAMFPEWVVRGLPEFVPIEKIPFVCPLKHEKTEDFINRVGVQKIKKDMHIV